MAPATCSGIQCSGTLTKLISSDAANNKSHASIKFMSTSAPGLTVGIAMSQTSAICGKKSFFIRKSTAIFLPVQGLPPFPGRISRRGVKAGRAKQQAQAVPRAESTRLPVTAAVAGAAVEPVPYTVEQGDTLWYLAERFHTSVETLLTLNGIADRDLVLERSVLLIPSPREASEDVSSPAAGGGESGMVVDVGQVEDGMASSEEVAGEGPRGGEQWSAGHEVRELPRPWMLSATTCGVVAASLLALGVILLTVSTAVRGLMRRRPAPYREQKRNTERIALTNSRFRSALSIDRSTRPASARAMRGGSEGEGQEPVTDTGVDLTAEVAMATIRRDREEAWALYGGGMEQSYESFLRDCGARKAGRFQGGMPSKFKDRSKR